MFFPGIGGMGIGAFGFTHPRAGAGYGVFVYYPAAQAGPESSYCRRFRTTAQIHDGHVYSGLRGYHDFLHPAEGPVAGLASLAAVGVMGTGIFGVMTARYIFKVIRIESPEIRGFMLGLTAHGIGVARGFQISNEIGTFAGLGMSLNGLLTAFLVPLVVTLHFVLF
ncbi:MAG: LrgB family protein [Alcaligenaceae bacterium]|nr:LrgB family protein [Alcaligenaceae bacterium]